MKFFFFLIIQFLIGTILRGEPRFLVLKGTTSEVVSRIMTNFAHLFLRFTMLNNHIMLTLEVLPGGCLQNERRL